MEEIQRTALSLSLLLPVQKGIFAIDIDCRCLSALESLSYKPLLFTGTPKPDRRMQIACFCRRTGTAHNERQTKVNRASHNLTLLKHQSPRRYFKYQMQAVVTRNIPIPGNSEITIYAGDFPINMIPRPQTDAKTTTRVRLCPRPGMRQSV